MKLKIYSIFSVASFCLDGLIVALSFMLANWIRFFSGWFKVENITGYPHYRSFILLVVIVQWVVFKYLGLYRKRRGISGVDEFTKIFQGVLVSAVIIAAITFLIKFFEFSRLVIGISALLTLLGVWIERILLRRSQVLLRRRGFGITRILVVGTKETAKVLLQRLKQNPGLGYRVVGIISEGKSQGVVEGVKVVGSLAHFTRLVVQHQPDEVIFALPATAHGQLIPMLVSLQDTQVKYKIVSDLFGIITNPLENDVLLGIPIFEMKEAPLGSWHNRAKKRIFDFVLASIGTLVLSPVFLVLAVSVKLSSPGPILFRQKRVGRDGKIFHMLKFRSMKTGSETVAFTAKDDPRVTSFGSFIRKTSLDELPQLFNVLFGQMSLVGPRPRGSGPSGEV